MGSNIKQAIEYLKEADKLVRTDLKENIDGDRFYVQCLVVALSEISNAIESLMDSSQGGV